jgi:hypothetical protein
MRFKGVTIVTLSEGEVNELHIGLTGPWVRSTSRTWPTKRGVACGAGSRPGSRAAATATGTKSSRSGDKGEPVRGERRINPQQEAIVKRIFQDYARGVSPRTVAKQLNWDRRRPRYLFTGPMRCGVCGVGCVNARNKGTCINKTTMRPDDLETAVFEGLQHRLMDSDLMAVFCEGYTRHMNALTREHNAAREGAKAELARVDRDLDRLVQALLDGAPARTVKDRMAQLEARKDVLEAQLAQGGDVRCRCPGHPHMASVYRERVANLRETLAREGCQAEAGILGLAAKAKGPLEASDPVVACTKLVAGARNHLNLLFDAPRLAQ